MTIPWSRRLREKKRQATLTRAWPKRRRTVRLWPLGEAESIARWLDTSRTVEGQVIPDRSSAGKAWQYLWSDGVGATPDERLAMIGATNSGKSAAFRELLEQLGRHEYIRGPL